MPPGFRIAPTGRLVALTAAGVLPLALVVWNAALYELALVYAAALAAAGLIDLALCPRPRDFVIDRDIPDPLFIGRPNTISYDVFARALRPAVIELRPARPLGWPHHQLNLTARVRPHSVTRVSYATTPPARGWAAFGPDTLRIRSPWGLMQMSWRCTESADALVYPNLPSMREYDLLARRHLLMQFGFTPRRRYGRGQEFDTIREYTPDDEMRDINWTATARRGKLMVNTFRTEQSQSLMLVLDAGRLMATTVGGLTKLDHAINTALLLAHVATSHRDAIGCLVFGGRVMRYLPPHSGAGQVHRLLATLSDIREELVESDYAAAFTEYLHRMNRRTLAVLMTDIIDEESSRTLLTYSRLLHPRHVLLAVAMRDGAADDRAAQSVDSADAMYAKAAALQLLHERRAVVTTLTRGGAHVVDELADRITPHVVARYLDIKARHLL